MPVIVICGGIGALVGALLSTTDIGKEMKKELDEGFDKWKKIEDTELGKLMLGGLK